MRPKIIKRKNFETAVFSKENQLCFKATNTYLSQKSQKFKNFISLFILNFENLAFEGF